MVLHIIGYVRSDTH